jgi:uncharacterized membrane protein
VITSAQPLGSLIPDARAYRLVSIDLLRGLVLVLMAIDHVRDYVMFNGVQDPTANPDVGAALFFTRWITHFCAPVFVFLAGTSAGLMTARKSQSELGRLLLTRGIWLILIEFVVISTAWTFAPFGIEQLGGLVVVPMGVIWAIGASMVVLAGAQFLGRRACLGIGVAILVGHNLLDPVWPVTNPLQPGGPWWAPLHSQAGYVVVPFYMVFQYPLLPWIGVMLLGYGTAAVFEEPPKRRNALLLTLGMVATTAFVAIRAVGVYGDPNPWGINGGVTRTLIDFLNTTKYPPSLLFLLMTLGPASVLCSFADRVPEAVTVKQPLIVFGRVPFAFYVAHLYLIHTLSVGLGVIQGFEAHQFVTGLRFFPKGYGLGLPGVYVVWLVVIVLLYPFCKWVEAIKARRGDWWLSYL